MPIKNVDFASKAKGGTEMMCERLVRGLTERGREDLLEHFDIYPSRVQGFDPNRQSIYYLHDLPGDPASNHLMDDKGVRFDHLVFVSNCQQQQYNAHYGLTGENSIVIANAIEPLPRNEAFIKWYKIGSGDQSEPIRFIYHTTPHRGLEILVPAFIELYNDMKEEGVHIILDVYSSFSIYGWSERDAPYEALFEQCREHPGINYHGAVDNDTVREALINAHVFAYPSIWPETSCIAMIEAMSAGCRVVHSNYGALPETSGGLTDSYSTIAYKDEHATLFYYKLKEVTEQIANDRFDPTRIALNLDRTNEIHSEESFINQWIKLLDSIKNTVD